MDQNLNPFTELVEVLKLEELIRLRHRLKKRGRDAMVAILTDEIKEREEGKWDE